MTDPLLAFRGDFPILARTTYLVSNSLGAMPRMVADRLAEYVDEWATLGVRAWASGWWEMPLRVGDEIAPLIGASAGEVVMTPNVTMAQAQVLSALDYPASRNRIVMTALDFPSVRYVYQELATRLGARDRRGAGGRRTGSALTWTGSSTRSTSRTRLVAISHVLFRSAYIVDVEPVCRRARDVGALVSLDSFHAVGVHARGRARHRLSTS